MLLTLDCDPLLTAVHETLDVRHRTCFMIKVMSPCITIYDMRHRERQVYMSKAQCYKPTLLEQSEVSFADSCVRQHKCGNITSFAIVLPSIYWLIDTVIKGSSLCQSCHHDIGMKHMEIGCFLLCIWVRKCA